MKGYKFMMNKLKAVFSSDGATVIYTYIITIIVAFLAYVLTIRNEHEVKTKSSTLNGLIDIFQAPIYLIWFTVLFLLLISIVLTISWIRKRYKHNE